jgi:hypothetical protein
VNVVWRQVCPTRFNKALISELIDEAETCAVALVVDILHGLICIQLGTCISKNI